MKRAAVAVQSLASSLLAGLGLEGAFLLGGAAAVTYGSSFISPFAPWLVAGSLSILAGIALAIPERRK